MSTSGYVVISYHHCSLTFKQLLIVMTQPLTPLTVGHWIWLKDVDKCLKDTTGIITGVSKLEKSWIIYQLHLPSISTTTAVSIVWSSPPSLIIHVQYFLQCFEGQSAVSIWDYSASSSLQIGVNTKFEASEVIWCDGHVVSSGLDLVGPYWTIYWV